MQRGRNQAREASGVQKRSRALVMTRAMATTAATAMKAMTAMMAMMAMSTLSPSIGERRAVLAVARHRTTQWLQKAGLVEETVEVPSPLGGRHRLEKATAKRASAQALCRCQRHSWHKLKLCAGLQDFGNVSHMPHGGSNFMLGKQRFHALAADPMAVEACASETHVCSRQSLELLRRIMTH
mmetsp:Transcript_27792/g.61371  ORF Transcript_27792/g.61371 Transcript_27792/m.61371 type:complete len:182 (+) Transcript_27792:1229-1774(+)